MSLSLAVNRMCRLCLKCVKTGKDFIDIFQNDENCSLPIRIMACTALEVNKNDGLPKNICTECRYCLEKFYLFRKKSKNADTKLRRQLKLINAGKIRQLLENDDEDQEEYEECLAFLAKWDGDDEKKYQTLKREMIADKQKWELERKRLEGDKIQLQAEKQQLENLRREKEHEYKRILNQTQTIEVENDFQLIIKHKPTEKTKSMVDNTQISKHLTECSEREDDEYAETVFVFGGTPSNSENYASKKTESIVGDLSGNHDEMKVSLAETESRNVNTDEEDYTNVEYLEIDDEETQTEEIISMEYSSISKVIRNTIASCSGISPDDAGIDCKLFKVNGKSTKIAVKTKVDPKKTFYLGLQENDDPEIGKLHSNICTNSFKTLADLNKHNLKVHERKLGRKCNWCPKWFSNNYAYGRHLRVHSAKKPFKCEKCGESFCQKEMLKRHKPIHSGEEKPHKCSFCDKEFLRRAFLKQHISRKHSAHPVINK